MDISEVITVLNEAGDIDAARAVEKLLEERDAAVQYIPHRCNTCRYRHLWTHRCDRCYIWERPGAAGKAVLQMSGRVVSCDFDGPREEVTGFAYVSHFSTCPQARQFRHK